MIYIDGNIKDIRIGEETVSKVYAGNNLVWQTDMERPLVLEYEIESWM
ncbi:MAG: hypothetical protein LUF85_13035 [Bacteroides sp.]|nr:hypothetical protein [Bacteroides sp.]